MNSWKILRGKTCSSLASFMSCVEELATYKTKTFGNNVEFKKYLHGVSDARTGCKSML